MQEIANDILGEQTPKRLFAVRAKLYELLVNCIPPELIIKKLMVELARKLDDELKHKVADCAAFFEHRLQASSSTLFCDSMFICNGMLVSDMGHGNVLPVKGRPVHLDKQNNMFCVAMCHPACISAWQSYVTACLWVCWCCRKGRKPFST